MKNLTLIGTDHLMNKEEIDNLIRKEKPDVIGVELCQLRFEKRKKRGMI